MSIDDVSDKLSKLVRMLSSPRDGEVVAAAQAIIRTLKGAGTDIHALAKRVEGGSGEQKHSENGNGTSARRGTGRRGKDEDDPDWHSMAIYCRDNSWRLSEKEEKFVSDMVRWTARGWPSENQARWLHSIYTRLNDDDE
jgi:hypothetical protein